MQTKDIVHRTLTGRSLNLTRLTEAERFALAAVLNEYRKEPDWTRFAARWMKALSRQGIGPDSVLFGVCDDLEARLGIAQGKASPPDYRHYLLAMIEERYGSRYKFCKETGIDQGQLSRILAGQADFSFESLRRLLRVLHASLVVATDESLRAAAKPDEACRTLEAAAH